MLGNRTGAASLPAHKIWTLAFMASLAGGVALPAQAVAAPCQIVGGVVNCGASGEGGNGGSNPGSGNGQNGGNGPGNGPDQNGDGGLYGGVNPAPLPVRDTSLVLAEAFDSMEFPVPVVNTFPSAKTFVRVRTSFWIDPAQGSVPPAEAEVGAADGVQPQRVVATAELRYIRWDLGETKIKCYDTGKSDDAGSLAPCDHHFQYSSAHAGAKHNRIVAVPHWEIKWSCTGACTQSGGTLHADYASAPGILNLPVGEIQTEAN